MPLSDWQRVKLGDLGEVNRGRSRHRPRDASHLYGGVYPFIQTGDIKASGGRIRVHNQTYSEAGLAQSRLWPKGTMVITIAANIAETAILSYPACFPDSVVGFIANPELADAHYIEYLFRFLRQQIQQENVGTGSVQDNINLQTLQRLNLVVPQLHEQKAIASVLGALDDKIELNRRMNSTLEAMARTLFKSWFVDFDPVRAKMEGKQPFGMAAETAALFPSRLVPSELGDIPEGWTVDCLGAVADSPRNVVQPNETSSETPYIGLEHMPRRCIALTEWGQADSVISHKSAFGRGDFLFGKLRSYFHKVGIAALDGICSTDIAVVRSAKAEFYAFVLSVISSDEFVQYTEQLSNGAKMPRINWSDMAKYELTLPSTQVAAAFDSAIRPQLEKIIANIHESMKLSKMRDYLLPKLISGDIRIPDAEKFVEAI